MEKMCATCLATCYMLQAIHATCYKLHSLLFFVPRERLITFVIYTLQFDKWIGSGEGRGEDREAMSMS